MRVLFVVQPAWSHLHTAVPLALELGRRGHEVLLATGDDHGATVDGWGVPTASLGPSRALSALVPRLLAAHPGAQIRLLAALSAEQQPRVLEVAEAFRPDLVVRDSYAYSGVEVARRHGVPQVVLGVGIRPERRWLEAVLSSSGIAGDDPSALHGDLWLSGYPPLLDRGPEDLPQERHIRPSNFAGAVTGHEGVKEADVYVTLGTVCNQDRPLLSFLVRALDECGQRVLVTTGRDVDPDGLGRFSPRVEVRRYVPQGLVLPRVRAVLCHGGFNTVLPALAAGRPVGIVPLSMDHPVTAERCLAAGVATVVATGTTAAGLPFARPGDVTAEQVVSAVVPLLEDARLAARVRALGNDVAELPGPERAADEVERLLP